MELNVSSQQFVSWLRQIYAVLRPNAAKKSNPGSPFPPNALYFMLKA